jgi:hypothetical protein
MTPCPWPSEKTVIVSGGGYIPENAARENLNSHDGTVAWESTVRSALPPTLANQRSAHANATYVERRNKLSLEALDHKRRIVETGQSAQIRIRHKASGRNSRGVALCDPKGGALSAYRLRR